MPREPLDAREDLAKERPCQAAFGELQRDVGGHDPSAARCRHSPRTAFWVSRARPRTLEEVHERPIGLRGRVNERKHRVPGALDGDHQYDPLGGLVAEWKRLAR